MSKLFVRSLAGGALVAVLAGHAMSDVEVAGNQGPSSSATPYVVPSPGATGVRTISILTVGDSVNNKPDGVTPYRLIGLPDGMGGYDNGDGTFTLLVNHEMGGTSGIARAHGSAGATVSAWIVDRKTLKVISGQDLIRDVATWSSATQSWTVGTAVLNRFCSGDLPEVSAFYNSVTGLGARERIYMNGEENGTGGRAFAHIASGPNAGLSFQLPRLGTDSWENILACPKEQDKTIVACIDDTTPGQVYMYIGTKTATGNEIQRAGLTNGKLWGVIANATRTEDRINGIGTAKGASAPFTLVDLGDLSAAGAVTETTADNAGVTEFLRPEDGHWSLIAPNEFFFCNTDRFDQTKNGTGTQIGRTKLWRMRFTDIANPELGGQITLLLDGTEPTQMIDNLCVDSRGNLILQEDTGGQTHNGKIYHFDVATAALTEICKHDVARFGEGATPATAPFSNDEEASGVFDASALLGPGWFLMCDQAHGGTSPGPELVENGQLLALFVPGSAVAPTFMTDATASTTTPIVGQVVTLSATADAPSDGAISYAWTFGDGGTANGAQVTHAWTAPGTFTATVTATHTATSLTATSSVDVTVSRPITAVNAAVTLNFANSKDTVVVSGQLPIPSGFSPAGQTVTIDVGGIQRSFTLDAKGKGTAAGATVALKLRKVGGAIVTQKAPFNVTIKGALAGDLDDDGLVNAAVNDQLVSIPVTITFGGRTHDSLVELVYTAKAGKKGTAR